MTRVSLKEAYDNKDVVAQIYAIRDIAEGAEDTANGAVSTANTASEHVDALVPQVEGAVQNANNASASAQASAQTVQGYEGRLQKVETDIQTLDGFKFSGTQQDEWKQIGIKDSQGDVTHIRMNRNEIQFIGNNIYRNTVPSGADSRSIINKAYVESTDGVTNNLVHTNANETILSNKTIGDTAHLGYRLDVYGSNTSGSRKINIVGGTDVQSTAPSNFMIYPYISWSDSNNNVVAGIRAVHNSDGTYSLQAMVLNANGTEKYLTIAKGD